MRHIFDEYGESIVLAALGLVFIGVFAGILVVFS